MTHVQQFAVLDHASGGLVSLLRHAYAMRITGVLEFATPHGTGTIALKLGAIRAASFHDRAGLPALTALSLLANGSVNLLPGEPSTAEHTRDQFGLLTPVVLDLLATTTAKVKASTITPAVPVAVLPVDEALGTPIPAASTTTDDLLRDAKLVVRRATTDAGVPQGDFPEDFIGGLVSAELRGGAAPEAPAGPPAWEPPALGQMIGRCYLSARIGEGATALVYRALHVSLKIDVAIKILRPADEHAPTARTLSLHEAQLLARLSHQNVVRVLDASDQDPWPHLVMEFVDGPSLAELIGQTGRVPPETAIAMLLQVAEGLAHAHAVGVTHCDIKPGNILIDRQQVVKLTDLGVARATLGDSGGDGRKVAGTPAYIAPEVVVDGIGAATPASDIYSLGATAFHAVTGHLPFEDPDPLAMMVAHVQQDAPRAATLVAALPAGLDELLSRMLSRDAARRPSAAQLAQELRVLQMRGPGFGTGRQQVLPSAIFATVGRAWRDLRSSLDQILGRGRPPR